MRKWKDGISDDGGAVAGGAGDKDVMCSGIESV